MTADYPVRTPLLYWVVLGALVVLAVFGLGLTGATLLGGAGPGLTALAALLAIVPVVYIATTGEYRARGVIRLAAGEASVPDAAGRPQVFRLPGLRISTTAVEVRVRLYMVPVANVERGVVLDFREADRRRRISTLTLVDRGQQDSLLEDLARIIKGEAPRGHIDVPPLRPPGAPPPSSDLEAQLDRELAALD